MISDKWRRQFTIFLAVCCLVLGVQVGRAVAENLGGGGA